MYIVLYYKYCHLHMIPFVELSAAREWVRVQLANRNYAEHNDPVPQILQPVLPTDE